ncbi:unnamed protein product [Choristocarpus tenellus]
MREALGNLKGNDVENWRDDLFCYSSSFDEHMTKLRLLLTRLKQYGLSVNFPKSSWCMPSQEFVGMNVGRDELSPAPSEIIAVAKLDPPSTVEQLRSFLGMTGYMRQFVPNYGEVAAPLTNILRNKGYASKRDRKMIIPLGTRGAESL